LINHDQLATYVIPSTLRNHLESSKMASTTPSDFATMPAAKTGNRAHSILTRLSVVSLRLELRRTALAPPVNLNITLEQPDKKLALFGSADRYLRMIRDMLGVQ